MTMKKMMKITGLMRKMMTTTIMTLNKSKKDIGKNLVLMKKTNKRRQKKRMTKMITIVNMMILTMKG